MLSSSFAGSSAKTAMQSSATFNAFMAALVDFVILGSGVVKERGMTCRSERGLVGVASCDGDTTVMRHVVL